MPTWEIVTGSIAPVRLVFSSDEMGDVMRRQLGEGVGAEFRLTIPEAMALLRGAPKMCAAWHGDENDAVRRDAFGRRHAFVMAGEHKAWWAIEDGGPMLAWKQVETLQEAKCAADAALRSAGFVLEEG